MLAALAIACRPHGAPRWDEAGVVATIAKLNGLLLADVAHAVLRAAEDATAKTPGVIAATTSIHWRERSPHHTAPREPHAWEACTTCGRHIDRCICGERATRPPRPASDETRQSAAELARQAIAEARAAFHEQEAKDADEGDGE